MNASSQRRATWLPRVGESPLFVGLVERLRSGARVQPQWMAAVSPRTAALLKQLTAPTVTKRTS
jgi:hypothetical protein